MAPTGPSVRLRAGLHRLKEGRKVYDLSEDFRDEVGAERNQLETK